VSGPGRDPRVDLWTFSLTAGSARLQELESWLTPAERQRADRYHFDSDRYRFVVSRGTLRQIVGRRLETQPGRVPIATTPQGKPVVVDAPFELSLSHSAGLGLLAVGKVEHLGVDLEPWTRAQDMAALEAIALSPGERHQLSELPDALRPAAALSAWVQKEACLKGRGTGLLVDPRTVEVRVDLRQPGRLIRIDGCGREADRWTVQRLAPRPGYTAAVAWRGPTVPILARTFQPGGCSP
jgi:4'-phosphopantetheinyl transferase